MKRVIALVLCIVCMAGVALGDAASYMGGVWLCDEFDWAGIAIIHGRDIYTDEVLAYWFDLRRGGQAVTVYAVRCNGEKVQFIDQNNKVIEFDKDGDTITNGKVHYTRVR